MSRLVAEARGLYYRTQDPLAEPVAALLELPRTGVVNILDPCAGEGIFLDRLYTRMSAYAEVRGSAATVVSYGVEPNLDRARRARRVFTHLLRADFFHTRIARGAFQLGFLNPPYDADAASVVGSAEEGGPAQQRLEIRFLRRTTQLLAPMGVLVLIIPQAQLTPAARFLAANYTAIRCWRYPDLPWASPAEEETDRDGRAKPAVPLFGQFHQVVLFASRRRAPVAPAEALVKDIGAWALAGEDLPPIPTDPTALIPCQHWQVPADPRQPEGDLWHVGDLGDLGDVGAYPVEAEEGGEPSASADDADLGEATPPPASPLPLEFADASLDLETLAGHVEASGAGVWAAGEYRAQRWPDLARLRLGMERPLGPLRLGHLITLAAVGLLNGRVLTGPDGRRLLVKGACRKEIVTESGVEEGPGGRQTMVKTETERFVIALWAVDLATGDLIHIV